MTPILYIAYMGAHKYTDDNSHLVRITNFTFLPKLSTFADVNYNGIITCMLLFNLYLIVAHLLD